MCMPNKNRYAHTYSREEGPPLLLEEIGQQQSSGSEGVAAGHGSVELAVGGGQV